MKLGMKLLAAPLLTAAVVLIAGQVNTYLLNGQAENGLTASRSSLDDFKTMANANQQIAEVHANVYRTVAIVGSLDDDKVKSLRAEFAKELEGVKRVVGTVAQNGMEGSDPVDTKAIETLLATYAKQADSAINFATIDPNTGIAGMQRAEVTFKELIKASAAVTTLIESNAEKTIVASQGKGRTISLVLTLVALGIGGVAVWLSWLMQV